VDGLNPAALIGGNILMNGGAWTSNARAAVEQTHTLPNHASILTGRLCSERPNTRDVQL